MSHQLQGRDSTYWLRATKMPDGVGPGLYEGANKTGNSWNRVASRDSTTGRGASRGTGPYGSTGYGGTLGATGVESIFNDSDARALHSIPFNSKIKRADFDRIEQTFNPGPGTYQNVKRCAAFKNEFVTKEDFQTRQIFSQGGGPGRAAKAGGNSYSRMNPKEMEAALSQGMDVSYDVYGNPSYTIKEGGTLKKKLQPYAASKTGRDGLNIARERLEQVTAPGTYTVGDGFGPKAANDPLRGGPAGQSANERLAAMGILHRIFDSAGTDSQKQLQLAVMQSREMNSRSEQRKANYYAAQGAEDYLISENQLGEERDDRGISRKSEAAPGSLIKPVNADMMKRVRNTAKWSQLYKSGPSFPPKHKVLFINQDEEDGQMTPKGGVEEDTKEGLNNDVGKKLDNQGKPLAQDGLASPQLNEILSTGTHKHHNQSEFDEIGKIFPAGESLAVVQENFSLAQRRHQGGQLQPGVEQVSNVKVFQKMKSDDTQYRIGAHEASPGVSAAHGAAISGVKQSASPAGRKHTSSNMKRQKSIKLNLPANAKGNAGLRKSSEIAQDTFRGGESQERIIQQASATHVQGLAPTAPQDPNSSAVTGNQVDATSPMVNRIVGSAGEPSGSIATAERPRQEHLIVSQISGDMNAVPSAFQQPPPFGPEGGDGLSVPSSLPMSGPPGAIARQMSGGKGALHQDAIQAHVLQSQLDQVPRGLGEADGGVQRAPVVQSKGRQHLDSEEGRGRDDSELTELKIRRKKSAARREPTQLGEQEGNVGPGQYEPKIEAARKQAPAYSWSISKSVREETQGPAANKQVVDNPGPGKYNQQQFSIGMKMMKGMLHQETVLEDKNRGQHSYQKLVQKVSAKAKGDYASKKEKHVLRKKYMANKVQPGAHQNIFKLSDFRQEQKQDYLQFFGTTDAKIKEDNFYNSKNSAVGPGTYEASKGAFLPKSTRRANTASFTSNRQDLLFSGNANPGPQDYATTTKEQSFTTKQWQTNIGAFGTTERKFASLNAQIVEPSAVPGPGSYAAPSFVQKKYATKKVKGQQVKVKNQPTSSFFQSVSTRSFDPKLEKHLKFNWPAAGHYEEKESFGAFTLQGGAPNNFLLLKNNKSAAPFQSTVPRFVSETPKCMSNELGPGQYSTARNFDLSLDQKNRADVLFPGYSRQQAFPQVERFTDATAAPKNFRIGRPTALPCVGTYNAEASSFSGAKSFNCRFS